MLWNSHHPPEKEQGRDLVPREEQELKEETL
jgi:hypothetical protein